MLVAPHRKGHRVVPKVLKGARGKVAAPSDARYVLTELHAALANAVLHATVGAPTFAVRHDHLTDFTNVGTKTHAQIDTHIADGTIHFIEGAISHLNILNIGTNTHADIDTHIADGTIHFIEGAISHLNILNIGTNTHTQIDTHLALVNEHIDWTNATDNFKTTGTWRVEAAANRQFWIDATNPDHLKKKENLVLHADPTNVHANTGIFLYTDGTKKFAFKHGYIYFGATEEGNIFWHSTLPKYMGTTKEFRVGSILHHIEFKADGELNLVGTARVERHWVIDAKRFKMPAANYPSEGFTGLFYTLDFDKTTDESAYVMDHIPFRKVAGGDIEVSIDWCWHGILLAYDVVWGIEYKAIKEGDTVTGAGTVITETGTALTGNVLERTTFTTKILGSALEADDNIAIRVFRSAEDPEDNLNVDAKLINVHFHFIQDKLGKATESKPEE